MEELPISLRPSIKIWSYFGKPTRASQLLSSVAKSQSATELCCKNLIIPSGQDAQKVGFPNNYSESSVKSSSLVWLFKRLLQSLLGMTWSEVLWVIVCYVTSLWLTPGSSTCTYGLFYISTGAHSSQVDWNSLPWDFHTENI